MVLKRVVYKTSHNIFFRRCWFVKETAEDGDYLSVRHGLRGRITTRIPKAGTIFRFIHRKK
jgi:hypothetical protein